MNQIELQRRVQLAALQYDLLGHAGLGLTQLRTISPARSYFYGSKNQFITGAKDLIRQGGHDIFVGIAPRNRPSGDRDSVKVLSCVVLDIDPLSHPVTNQVSESLLGEVLTRQANSTVAFSGSGCHVYIPINPLRVQGSVQDFQLKIKSWGMTRGAHLSSVGKVDNIFDLPRIIRLWGSINSKTGKTCVPINIRIEKANIRLPQVSTAVARPSSGPTPVISNGSRNSTLTSLAGVMRRRGFGRDSIFSALMSQNEQKCNPPLSQRQVRSIVQSILRYEAKDAQQVKPKSKIVSLSDGYFNALTNRKPGYLCGLKNLDQTISGFKKGTTTIIGARPNEGKTTLITQILGSFAKQGLRCLFFPTQLGAQPVYDKLISAQTGIPLKKFQNGQFDSQELSRIQKVKKQITKLPFYIVQDFGLTPDKLKASIQQFKPDVVALDYIQALAYKQGSPQEIGNAMRSIKELNGKYDIPFIVGSQLNRGGEDKQNSLARIKGSGAIEQLADLIAYLSTVDRTDYPRKVDLCIVKSRYSATDTIKLNFYSTTAMFTEA